MAEARTETAVVLRLSDEEANFLSAVMAYVDSGDDNPSTIIQDALDCIGIYGTGWEVTSGSVKVARD